jgi:hypothetical protein
VHQAFAHGAARYGVRIGRQLLKRRQSHPGDLTEIRHVIAHLRWKRRERRPSRAASDLQQVWTCAYLASLSPSPA